MRLTIVSPPFCGIVSKSDHHPSKLFFLCERYANRICELEAKATWTKPLSVKDTGADCFGRGTNPEKRVHVRCPSRLAISAVAVSFSLLFHLTNRHQDDCRMRDVRLNVRRGLQRGIAILAIVPLWTGIAQAQFDAAAPEPIGKLSGSLLIHGGGTIATEVIDRFIELAGGKNARVVIVPTASFRCRRARHSRARLRHVEGSRIGLRGGVAHPRQEHRQRSRVRRTAGSRPRASGLAAAARTASNRPIPARWWKRNCTRCYAVAGPLAAVRRAPLS